MRMHPILAALRMHKSGVVLIALQIALTLAIVCNAGFIMAERINLVNRPTGLNENNLVVVQNSWVGMSDIKDKATAARLDSLTQQDLAALRAIPDVTAVTTINTMPLQYFAANGGDVSLKPKPDGGNPPGNERSFSSFYFVNRQGLSTLGLKLIAGRNFAASEIDHSALAFGQADNLPVGIVSDALARKLFPKGNAVGKVIYLDGQGYPTRVIGVVAHLMTPSGTGYYNAASGGSLLLPQRLDTAEYVLRTAPGRMRSVMHAVRPALYKVSRMRTIRNDSAVQSYSSIRAGFYRQDVGVAVVMGVMGIILIIVTTAGILGLTSFWVEQRHKQIGIRRALGARKVDILRYFQIENLIIAAFGSAAGIIVAVGLNLALMQHVSAERLPIWVVLAGVAFILILGQAAVLVPARRAANVPPVVATRSV